MADQKRTAADLVSLLPDNTTGLIQAQTMRDFVLSTMEVRGAMTGIGVSDPYALTTTPQPFDSYDTVVPGSANILFDDVAGAATILPGGDGIYLFSFAVNWMPMNNMVIGIDVQVNSTPVYTFWQALSNGNMQTQTVAIAIPLVAGDVVDGQVYNQTGANSATAVDCAVSAVRIG
jgi:hypothetical protein